MVIIIFNLVASLVYKYVFNYSPSFIYSDVLENYDICFIKNLVSYLVGCCLPAVVLFLLSLFILSMIALFIRGRLIIMRSSVAYMLGQKLVSKIIHDTAELGLKMKLIYMNGGLFSAVFIVNLIVAIQIRSGDIPLFVLFCASEFIYGIVAIIFMTFNFMFEHSFKKNELRGHQYDVDETSTEEVDKKRSKQQFNDENEVVNRERQIRANNKCKSFIKFL